MNQHDERAEFVRSEERRRILEQAITKLRSHIALYEEKHNQIVRFLIEASFTKSNCNHPLCDVYLRGGEYKVYVVPGTKLWNTTGGYYC